ncbi:MAG: hypothetical protein Ct9H300mP21_06460 [Pseudomonadota bacterium]|nr:MAG: hypothetical protein Ct9H300mP21_06460 [Pseudomonadota bacterium]
MTIINKINEFHDEMTAWRRDIHQHPELAYEEKPGHLILWLQAGRVWNRNSQGVGKNGCFGTIRNGEGPAIGLRADLDALPLQEKNTFNHASSNPGKMHACGQMDIQRCCSVLQNI